MEVGVVNCYGGGGGGDSGSEEELTVLPRHTKVVVTGNNRTKSVLVGLRGVVKKAVGLGGWHWLHLSNAVVDKYLMKAVDQTRTIGGVTMDVMMNVLTNGIEVKLQRNALSVIEAPTGNEEDGEFGCENIQWNGADMASDEPETQSHKPQRSRSRIHKLYGHKSLSQPQSCESQSKGSVSSSQGTTRVDLSKLETTALWRYWRHFNLVHASPNPSKDQLIDVVQRHFMSQQLDELQVIVRFVQTAKRLKTVCS